ncbi:MAG: GHMP kinase [Promethearchaeota archaeon]
MSISIPNALIYQLKKDHDEILDYLIKKEYIIQSLPKNPKVKKDHGEALALAYPIQGVLKYHGYANLEHRIAYFPSISFNNNCGFTVSYLKFDKKLKKDLAFLNGEQVFGEKLKRIISSLDFIRIYSKMQTKAVLVSRNFLNTSIKTEVGKGLGTSASGSAALALAATSIIYDNNNEYLKNRRLISAFSRYLSGSGCRSAAGGFSLWLSHPKSAPFDCFAIRLDRKEHQSFINKISLLTIPMISNLKTNQAHEIAPKSPFFLDWLKYRRKLIFEFINALDNHDLNSIGELAEYDSLCLQAVAMTAPNNENIIAWNPDTLKIMLRIRKLRANGYNVYYSIDTGPSLVLLTLENEKNEIIEDIQSITPDYNIIEGKIGGPCQLLAPNSPEIKKIKEEVNKFVN